MFSDDEDCRYFLKVLSEVYGRTGWRIHAWVLMSDHYHLMPETPEANLVEGMKWLQNTHTRRFNVRHRQWGCLFGDRYKSVMVEGSGLSQGSVMPQLPSAWIWTRKVQGKP